MFGVLNIYKPAGPTSRDVVDRVVRLVRPAKAGHAGTLDPIASGVLLVCVGQATRLIQYAQRLPKAYRGTFLLGRRSETDDVEREAEVVVGAPAPSREAVESALWEFVGEIDQRPPRHSAVKIGGRRAYDLARSGVEFEPAVKRVVIHRLAVVRYEYPELVLEVECGSGTYIRSLGRDLAQSLGTHAVMAGLERTAIGGFTAAAAIPLDELAGTWQEKLASAALLTAVLPALTVTPEELIELRHGRVIRSAAEVNERGEMAAYDAAGELVAILRTRGPGVLSALRNFA